MAFTEMSCEEIEAKIHEFKRLRAWLAGRNDRHLHLSELIRDLSAELVWRHSRASGTAARPRR
jgi:hypothetical protein